VSVGGEATVDRFLPDVEPLPLPESTAQDDAPLDFGDFFSFSGAHNADRLILESGLLSSPESSYLDDDHLAGDSTTGFFHQSTYGLDITKLLDDEPNGSDSLGTNNDVAAEYFLFEPQTHNLENQVS